MVHPLPAGDRAPPPLGGDAPFSLPPIVERSAALHGEADVSAALFAIVSQACDKGGEVWLLLQPENPMLPWLFSMVGSLPTQSVIRHLLCLESGQGSGALANVERAYRIVQYSAYISHYMPMFYYGQPEERFGATSLLPGLVLTPDAAMRLSADGQSAIVLRDPELLVCYREQLQQVAMHCQPLLISEDTALSMVQRPEQLTRLNLNGAKFLVGGLCSTAFWTPEIVRHYLNPQLPGYEQIYKSLVETIHFVRSLYQAGRQTVVMNPESLRTFAQTGDIPEYPEFFMSRPLDKGDRRYYIEALRDAQREGWYNIRLLKDIPFPLKPHWEIGLMGETHFVVGLCGKAVTRELFFQEPGLCRVFQDYLDALIGSKHAMSTEETEAFFQSLLDELSE